MKKLTVFFILAVLLGGCVKNIRYKDGQKFVSIRWGRKHSNSKVRMGNTFVYDTLSGRKVMKTHYRKKMGVCGGDYKVECVKEQKYRISIYDSLGRKTQKIVTDSSPGSKRKPSYIHRKYYKRK
jgi:hypothetical protein